MGEDMWKELCGNAVSLLESKVLKTLDGGFVEVGFVKEFAHRDAPSDLLIRRTDDQGKVVWEKKFGGKRSDWGSGVVQSEDGGFIVAGSTSSFGEGSGPIGGLDAYLVKVDGGGNLLWEKFYGYAEGSEYVYGMAKVNNGYAIVGYTNVAPSEEVYVLMVDQEGEKLLEGHYGGNRSDRAECVVQTLDGGFLILGETRSLGTGPDKNPYLLRFDGDGNKKWENAYPTGSRIVGRSRLTRISDGGFIAAGRFSYPDMRAYMVRVNQNGERLWQIMYGGPNYHVYAALETGQGEYYLVGYSQHYLNCTGAVLLRIEEGPVQPIKEYNSSIITLVIILVFILKTRFILRLNSSPISPLSTG